MLKNFRLEKKCLIKDYEKQEHMSMNMYNEEYLKINGKNLNDIIMYKKRVKFYKNWLEVEQQRNQALLKWKNKTLKNMGGKGLKENCIYSGVLQKKKQKSTRQVWKKRFVVITKDNRMYYFKSEEDTEPLGEFKLIQCTIQMQNDGKTFKLVTDKGTYTFMVVDDSVGVWISSINLSNQLLQSPLEVYGINSNEDLFQALCYDNEFEIPKYLIDNAKDYSEADDICHALFSVFQARENLRNFVTKVINDEIDNTATEEVLFRGNSVATRVVKSFTTTDFGIQYVNDTLGDIIRDIQNANEPLEIDPTRVSSQETIQANVEKIGSLIDTMLDRITSSINQCPQELRVVARILSDSVEEKFPNCTGIVLAGYFFLRYLCPAIMVPMNYSICSVDENLPNARRTLIICAKVLQTLGNNLRYSPSKEGYMLAMNDVIDRNRERINQFLIQLADVDDVFQKGAHPRISNEKVHLISDAILSHGDEIEPLISLVMNSIDP
eukprot:TRINITY_DN699_c0_g1_i2.p1 TRINITY_DN699_c0_g1~~TRINITY_DN699_c0_g1_i2.p1  ORF type:complete len:494 (+),score=90.10 TRINITY_DN699_c0_g1_i2:558-2039(+)